MEPRQRRPWWQIGCAALFGVLLALGVGVALGLTAGGSAAPVTAREHEIVVTQVQNGVFGSPIGRLFQLSYRVERIPDPEPGPCEDDIVREAAGGSDEAAWHVTAYGPFGLRVGGAILTCSGDARD